MVKKGIPAVNHVKKWKKKAKCNLVFLQTAEAAIQGSFCCFR
jgi:hypothetical protein